MKIQSAWNAEGSKMAQNGTTLLTPSKTHPDASLAVSVQPRSVTILARFLVPPTASRAGQTPEISQR